MTRRDDGKRQQFISELQRIRERAIAHLALGPKASCGGKCRMDKILILTESTLADVQKANNSGEWIAAMDRFRDQLDAN